MKQGLLLDLSAACIQTAARRAHRQLVEACLLDDLADPEREALVESLGRFLETADFPTLRAEHPELAGGTACRVWLQRSEDGTVSWEILPPG